MEAIRELITRFAKENAWGYTRIVGELRKLRIFSVSLITVRNILAESGIEPCPDREGIWTEFVKTHTKTLWQIDFFSKVVVTPTGLRQSFVLVFLHVKSRRVFCSLATFKPDASWMVERAESVLEQARAAELPVGQIVRDRDGKYVSDFLKVFANAGCTVIPTAPRAPNQNAFVERCVRSIKQECLSRFVCFGLSHLGSLVSEYVSFYNELRRISPWTTGRCRVSGQRSTSLRRRMIGLSVIRGWVGCSNTTSVPRLDLIRPGLFLLIGL